MKGRKDAHAELLRERVETALGRTYPLTAEVKGAAPDRLGERATADPRPRLDDRDADPSRLELPRRRQAGKAGADDPDVYGLHTAIVRPWPRAVNRPPRGAGSPRR